MLTRDIVKKIAFGLRRHGCLCADTGETIGETLVVLIGGVLEETIVADMYVSKEPDIHIDQQKRRNSPGIRVR